MTVVICSGIAPIAGDEALITATSAPNATGARWLLVTGVNRCDDPSWAWLDGTWDDGTAGRVMAWIDHLIVRRRQQVQ